MEVEGNMKNFWMVVWNSETGDFRRASFLGVSVEMAEKSFENAHPVYKVIHSGAGDLPPKTYHSLAHV